MLVNPQIAIEVPSLGELLNKPSWIEIPYIRQPDTVRRIKVDPEENQL